MPVDADRYVMKGSLVRQRARELGMSLYRLAKMARVTFRTIYKMADGNVALFKRDGEVRGHIDRVCDILGVTVEELFPQDAAVQEMSRHRQGMVNDELCVAEYTRAVSRDPYEICRSREAVEQICKMAESGRRNSKRKDSPFVEKYFCEEMTLEEIGQENGMTRQRVLQITERAMEKIRKRMKDCKTAYV